MDKVFDLLLIFIFCSISYSYSLNYSVEKKNVKISVLLDKDMTDVEQKVYVWSFISGNEQRIWDSAYVAPYTDVIELQAYAASDTNFKLIFDKKGPKGLSIYALPNDHITIRVENKDRNTIYKKAEKGDFHNYCIESILSKRPYWVKRHEANELKKEDSLAFYNRQLIKLYKKEIYQAEYPYISIFALDMISIYFRDIITSDSIRFFKEYLKKKYPYHPRLQSNYTHEASPIGIKHAQRIAEIEMQRNINESILRNTQIGNKLNLKLRDMNGKLTSLEDLPDNSYIYIDIWASWCKPCRRQFSAIKKIISKYADMVTVYAISIDLNHTLWKEAIKKDGTEQFIHVIGTNNLREILPEVRLLGLERIPRNFLLNKQKEIIAIDLNTDELAETLDCLIHQ